MSDGNFISRWSRRKLAAKHATEAPEEKPVEAQVPQPVQPAPPAEPIPLPPIESLTPESDFAPFMQPDVDPGLKREALKKLFDDPRFNVMDGLDVYIDDYTKTTPIPDALLEKMEQLRHLGIFKGDEIEAKDAAQPAAERPFEADEKLSQEQPVAPLPSVTPSEEIIAPAVGESEVSKG